MKNTKLQEMLNEITAQGSKGQIPQELIQALKEAQVIVPAMLPKNTDPSVIRHMIENQGKELPLPEGARPLPCILENAKGEKFLPVFTSEEEKNAGNNTPKFPLSLNMPFDSALEIVNKHDEIIGAVVNPFSHNILFQTHPKKQPEKEKIEMTLPQYHALARRQMESVFLPGELFRKKGELMQKLVNQKGDCLKEMYDSIYQDEIACPYTAEDFELLALNITDNLSVIQITMPAKNLYPHLCSSVFTAYDKASDDVWYYGIVHEADGNPSTLVQVMENGEPKNLGEAPGEGSELSHILSLIQGE